MIDKQIKMPVLLSLGRNVVTYNVLVATAKKGKTTIHEMFMLIMH
jgi:hypothetical protein